MSDNRIFQSTEHIAVRQLVSVFQTIGGPQGYYKEQQDSTLVCAAPPGDAAYLQSLFRHTNDQLTRTFDPGFLAMSGTTASVAHIGTDDVITVANLGDSRTTLFVRDDKTGDVKAFRLTQDHAPTLPEEKKRIEQNGGMVLQHRMFSRNSGNMGLLVSRAFGDASFDAVISHEPDILSFRLDDPDFGITPGHSVYIAVDSDGAHNNTSNTERAAVLTVMLAQGHPVDQIPEKLADLAIENGSGDNISVIFTRIEPNRNENMLLGVFDGHGHAGRTVSQGVCEIMRRRIEADRTHRPAPHPGSPAPPS